MIRKMLLVDDHPLVLSALQGMVSAIDPTVAVVLAEDSAQAAQRLQEHPDVDLVLLDLTLGDAQGVQALATLRASHPLLPVVVLSASDASSDVVAALDLGAMGFISKRTGHAELARALAMVMGGGVYVPATAPLSSAAADAAVAEAGPAPELAQAAQRGARLSPAQAAAVALAAAQQPGEATVSAVAAPAAGGPEGAQGAAGPGTPLSLRLGLTPRQGEVLALLLRGLSNKLIARELNLSVETVKDHVAAVLRALGVASRTQAVLAVARLPAVVEGEAPMPAVKVGRQPL